jgi:hypothetical protein
MANSNAEFDLRNVERPFNFQERLFYYWKVSSILGMKLSFSSRDLPFCSLVDDVPCDFLDNLIHSKKFNRSFNRSCDNIIIDHGKFNNFIF